MRFTIRPYQATDLPALHAINTASEPGVGAVSKAALGAIISQGDCHVATDPNDAPIGFLLTLGPDADYASKNYLWFDERFEDYAYVDRIAIAPDLRGQGVGRLLLDQILDYARENGMKIMPLCPFARSVFDKDESIRDLMK